MLEKRLFSLSVILNTEYWFGFKSLIKRKRKKEKKIINKIDLLIPESYVYRTLFYKIKKQSK